MEVPAPVRTHAVVMLRVSIKEKKLLQKAALSVGRKTSDFIRYVALKAAEAELAKPEGSGN